MHCCNEKFAEKRQMSFLAGGRREYGTNRDNQVYRIHADILRLIFTIDHTTSYVTDRSMVSLANKP